MNNAQRDFFVVVGIAIAVGFAIALFMTFATFLIVKIAT